MSEEDKTARELIAEGEAIITKMKSELEYHIDKSNSWRKRYLDLACSISGNTSTLPRNERIAQIVDILVDRAFENNYYQDECEPGFDVEGMKGFITWRLEEIMGDET